MWLIHIFVVITLRTHSDDYIKLKIPIPLRAFCEMDGYEMLKQTVHSFSLRLQTLSKQIGTDPSAFHIWCQCSPHSLTVAFLTFGFILHSVSVSPSWLWNVRGLSLCFIDLPSSLLRFLVCLGPVDVGPNKNVNKSCVLTFSRKNQSTRWGRQVWLTGRGRGWVRLNGSRCSRSGGFARGLPGPRAQQGHGALFSPAYTRGAHSLSVITSEWECVGTERTWTSSHLLENCCWRFRGI